MLKPHKLCKICTEIKDNGNTKLLNDIYNSSAFLKGSKTSLRQLAQDYRHLFNYENLLNHTKKHQFMSEKDYNNRNLRQIAKTAEKSILKKQLESIDVWNDVIEQGMTKLKDGELNIKAGDLLKAAKDKSDFHFKKQDQDLKMAEMIAFFASGESDSNLRKPYDRRYVEAEAVGDNDPAEEPAGSLEAGPDGSGGIYYPPSWDAPA